MKKVVLWVFVMVLVVSSVCGFLLSTEQLDLLRTQIYAFNTNPLYVNTGTAVSTYNLGSTPPASERGKQTNDQLANTVLTDLKKNNPQVTWTV
ncbi:hypothetical protein KY328_00900, partial [Candidatus Woesearchaeota archaeon]|nr:hypothetical protein [Candidatus Woesearchaeota archaeon]